METHAKNPATNKWTGDLMNPNPEELDLTKAPIRKKRDDTHHPVLPINEADVTLVEMYDDRFYKFTLRDGTVDYLPSVTTKLGIIERPWLARWRGDIGNEVADWRVFEAAQRGSRIHEAWRIYGLGARGCVVYQPIQRPIHTDADLNALATKYQGQVAILRYPDEMHALVKLDAWCRSVRPTFLASEQTVYSFGTRDAGTLDNVMRIIEGDYAVNGAKPLHLPAGEYIVDLKTGKSVDDMAWMQLAAYDHCRTAMGFKRADGALILHTSALTKSGIAGLATLYRDAGTLARDYDDYRAAAQLWERQHAEDRPTVVELPSLLQRTEALQP